jgi:phosphatidylinositol-3-phosphatase
VTSRERWSSIPDRRSWLGDQFDHRWRRGRIALAGVLVLAALLTFGVLGMNLLLRAQHYTKLEAIPPGSAVPVPAFSRVYLLVLENKSEEILGSPAAPYLNKLFHSGAISTDYQGIAHPSQPNYLALFSGSPQGVFDDEPHNIDAPTLADQLEAAGRTWRVFAEDFPADNCYTGASSTDGPDGPGKYVRKHNPAISFRSISGSADRCANIQPLMAFEPSIAAFNWIVPNECHIMHDCSVAQGDAWLRGFLPRILDSAAFRAPGSVLFITFDEGEHLARDNEVVAAAIGPGIEVGKESPIAHTHYSLLRTIQEGFRLPCLANSCEANTLGELFTP